MYSLTDIIIGPADIYVDNQNVGWTKAGVRIRVNKSMWFRPSFDGLGVSEVVKQTEDFYISTVLSEATLANLKRVWGLAETITNPNDSSSYIRIDFGGGQTVPIHTLKFIARERTLQVIFHKVIAVDFGEIGYFRFSETVMPVTFRALLDITKDVGEQIGYLLQGPSVSENNLILRLSIFKVVRSSFVCSLTIFLWNDSEDLVLRTLVYRQSYTNLVNSIISRAFISINLINRLVTRIATSITLVDRTTVLKQSTNNLICQLTKTT